MQQPVGRMRARAESAAPPAKCLAWPPLQQQQGPFPRSWCPPTAARLAPPSDCPDPVDLNVGGMLFTTNCATLEESQPQSMLAALVSGRHGLPRRDAQVRVAG